MELFADLPLPVDILKAVADMGFQEPTPIQAQTIPTLLQGRDVVGIAQTGTGKTAAFGLPALALCEQNNPSVQALILAPTRELAQQSAQALTDFAARCRRLNVVAVYGGSPYGPQISALRAGAQIVVGTPGRVMDLMEREELRLDNLKIFVLDEADEMLRMGFAEDVDQIARFAPEEAIRALFSATMPPAIEKVADQHLKDPVKVSIARQSSTVETVEQTYAVVPFKFKSEALQRVLLASDAKAAIVFVRTRMDAEQISSELIKDGFKAAAISGDVAQNERERIVSRIRSGDLDVLVATDVAARGLDVERIELVINYDVPREAEAYVHRIGRTGRAGREGVSITFFTPREKSRLKVIEDLTGTPMKLCQIPTPEAVREAQVNRLLEKLTPRLEAGEMEVYYTIIEELIYRQGLDLGDIAAAALALAIQDQGPVKRKITSRVRREEKVDEYGRFLYAEFEHGREKEAARGERKSSRRSLRGGRIGQGIRYRIEVGRRDGVSPSSILGAITNEGGLRGKEIGHIDIMPSFSLIEIPGGLSKEATKKIARAKIAGRMLRIREDQGPKRKRH